MNITDRFTIRRLILPMLLVVTLLLGGCQQQAEEAEAEPTMPPMEEAVAKEAVVEEAAMQLDLAGTAWILDSVGEPEAGLNAIEGVRSTLNFSVVNYLGTGGCNWYEGVYMIDSPKLTLRPPFQMRLSCTEPDGVMTQEGTFFGVLVETTDYVMENDKLVLLLDGTQRLATFSPAEAVDFEGTNWGLKMYLDNEKWWPVVSRSEVSAQFVDGDLIGNSGCNDYTATYMTEGIRLTIEGLESTDLDCDVNQEVMTQESIYLELLPGVVGYEVLGGALTLIGADGNAIMYFGAQ